MAHAPERLTGALKKNIKNWVLDLTSDGYRPSHDHTIIIDPIRPSSPQTANPPTLPPPNAAHVVLVNAARVVLVIDTLPPSASHPEFDDTWPLERNWTNKKAGLIEVMGSARMEGGFAPQALDEAEVKEVIEKAQDQWRGVGRQIEMLITDYPYYYIRRDGLDGAFPEEEEELGEEN